MIRHKLSLVYMKLTNKYTNIILISNIVYFNQCIIKMYHSSQKMNKTNVVLKKVIEQSVKKKFLKTIYEYSSHYSFNDFCFFF